MGTLFKIIVFVVIAFVVVGGLLLLRSSLEDSSPFAGKAIVAVILGVIITVVLAITNAAAKSIPGWIGP